MSALGNEVESAILDAMFHGGTFTGPEKIYIALFNTTVGDSGSGEEVSGPGYARLEVDANTTNFPGPTSLGTDGHAVENGIVFDFGEAGSPGWGIIVAVAAMDDESDGNVLMHGALSTAKEVGPNDPVLFPVGTLRFILR